MSTNVQVAKVILAAGGIVEKQTNDGGVQIAVIHRPRYGGEWNLPKGKLKKEESVSEAAAREVEEKTGCRVRITGFAGLNHYYHDHTPKVVLYWKMKPEGECTFRPSEEVDKLEWLTPAAAQERLSHAEEKDLVSQMYYHAQPVRRYLMRKSLATLWSKLSYRLFGSPHYGRLANALYEFRIRLQCRSERACSPPSAEKECEQAIQDSLIDAESALQEFDFDRGWQCLHTAQSMEIWGYDHDEVLNSRKILCKEASKLAGWRRKVITELVCHGNNNAQSQNDDKPRRRELYQATLVKNEQFNNLYHKIGIRGRNLKIAFFTLAAVVISLPLLARAGVLWPTFGDWRTIVTLELTGILGASFSVASSLAKSSVDANIPQQVLGSVVTWMRPVMGAAAAVAAYQLFQAGLLSTIIQPGPNPTLLSFVIAFIAGFSERFIIGPIEKILTKENHPRPDK